ncbi:arginine N-succinyltransferase [bacterium]|jgi:arginine N-succinyltransferase|nr:arginine N-succinyltransferase [bacterium]
MTHELAVLRPVQLSDLDALHSLAQCALPGLTSLSKDRRTLTHLIEDSLRSWEMHSDTPSNEFYLFVLEIISSKQIIGTSSIIARVGLKSPFYCYRLNRVEKHSKALDIQTVNPILELMETRHGPSEVGTLFLHPDFRGKGYGRLLSLGRFMFMACFPNRVDTTVIAEMRGISDDEGISPFWESLGRHFFQMSFPIADQLSSQDKQFIADLMPRYPIYAHLLSQEAQDVIGKPHPATIPAQRLLESEGFRYSHQVDIFDAGPKLSVLRDSIRTISDCQTLPIQIQSESRGSQYLICNGNPNRFRVVSNQASILDNSLVTSNHALQPLYLDSKDTVWTSPIQ